jgi:hypothetical protein
MLYPNGQRVLTSTFRPVSGALVACGALQYGGLRGGCLNRYVSDTYSEILGAVPSGYGSKAWLFAVRQGGISAKADVTVSSTASGTSGFPIEGTTSIIFTVADSDGQLISSGSGSAALSISLANALATASLNGSGEASFTITISSPTLGAEASLEASSTFTLTGSLVPYALGEMTGSTADNTTLTVDAITAALIAAAMSSPLHANIKQVNDVVVTGTGAVGNEWGP